MQKVYQYLGILDMDWFLLNDDKSEEGPVLSLTPTTSFPCLLLNHVRGTDTTI